MDYLKKLEQMDRHLEEHPKDYQTVISRLITYSNAIEQERKERVNARLREVAKYRKQRKEKQNEEQ